MAGEVIPGGFPPESVANTIIKIILQLSINNLEKIQFIGFELNLFEMVVSLYR